MIQRQPYLPRFVAGGAANPLGARAMYLSGSVYRIHGTNAPSTIGEQVSSGCIRMVNEDVIDLYSRVHVGTKVVVLPQTHRSAGLPVKLPRLSPNNAGPSWGGRLVFLARLHRPPPVALTLRSIAALTAPRSFRKLGRAAMRLEARGPPAVADPHASRRALASASLLSRHGRRAPQHEGGPMIARCRNDHPRRSSGQKLAKLGCSPSVRSAARIFFAASASTASCAQSKNFSSICAGDIG